MTGTAEEEEKGTGSQQKQGEFQNKTGK